MKNNQYNGKPCKKCGSVIRYLSTGKCVACRAAMNKEAWIKREFLKKHGVPMRPITDEVSE